MSESRKTEHLVSTYLANLRTPDGADVDGKVLADAVMTMRRTRDQRAAETGRITWRTIMMSRAGKLATAAVIVAAVLSLTVFDTLTKPTWALEDAIEALKNFRAVHIVGAFPGGTAEAWIRGNDAGTQSTDVVVRGSHGAITWTKEGSTYHYEPGQNTVYFEDAVTIGMTPWLGREMLEMLGTTETARVIRGKDPATGRDRVTLMCSLTDVHGPQSWIIEFDKASKLPVAIKQWPNLYRSGPPSFDAFKIIYYEDLPDDIFNVPIPNDARYVEKPLQIPEETVDVLSDPRDGMPTEGMTQQEAARKTVQALYRAVIDQDIKTLKTISPLCRNWGDEFLRKIVCKPNKDDRIVEVLEIRPIGKTGQSPLGPIAAVPVILKLTNGKKVQEQMIVQFRTLGGQSSCVVHGPYGLSRPVE